MAVELVLQEFIVLHCTMEGGSLFHSLTTSLVKKNLVQSRCGCLHFSFTPLLLVRDESSIKNSLIISVHICKSFKYFETPWVSLGDVVSRERTILSRSSLSSYDLLRKEWSIFVALCWTASNFAISFARWGDQNCTAYSKYGLTKLLYEVELYLYFWRRNFFLWSTTFC